MDFIHTLSLINFKDRETQILQKFKETAIEFEPVMRNLEDALSELDW